ncbi:4-hydroxybenzoate octaprenyltransferase [bacterium HR39]|nr:4-hydroxybenzoate octaprenyltransferase [bacterium HR39]
MRDQDAARLLPDQQLGWVARLPAGLRDYALLARWDRPIGTWLLLLPCWWGVLLPAGADVWTRAWYGLLFAIGAVAMRGAGCTVNDLADRDLDRRVERTRNRPLAAGRVRPWQAVTFFLAQSAVGLLVLALLPVEAALVALASIPLVLLYPFAKRVTYWPQAVLGLAFNWGALVGYAAITRTLDLPALLLYAAGVFWTLGYDTVYAHQDRADDAKVGVKSTALLFGAKSRIWIAGFYAAMLVLLLAAGVSAGLGWPYVLALALPAAMLAWQVHDVDFDDPASCLRHFRFHRDVGLGVCAALALGRLWAG